ncbi:MAG: Gfo/Idh/MocA family oxidoreductase [Phycisphaeraceae bacterium]|nr:Gfo/Idh/MocA family oxidoreductase [Phycisphaeraceae bacterium]
MSDLLRWGIIGSGYIAGQFANGVNHSKHCKMLAVASPTLSKANTFADEFNIPNRYGSYDQLLADPNVDAVHIATPHTLHQEWAIKAAKAGKHVLCEKPVGLNSSQAQAIIQAARENNVFFMEAYMYRMHPQIAHVLKLIQSDAIGELRFIQASFSYNEPDAAPDGLLRNNALGGGGILDVGGYPLTLARLLAGSTKTTASINPTQIKAVGIISETHVDEYTTASLEFPNGILAQITAGISVDMDNQVRIFGSKGSITILDPWTPACEGGSVQIILKNGDDEKTIDITTDQYLYGIEADTCAKTIAAGKQQANAPAMNWEDTIGTITTQDQWRKQIGLTYQADTPN